MAPLNLSDYGIIGNRTTTALVSTLGSIDWCCMPYLDSPSHFGSVLDSRLGGRFQLVPSGEFRSDQRYLQRTLVLETTFETPQGRAILTDWMPLKERGDSPSMICRQVDVIDGSIQWTLNCGPRFNYGKSDATYEAYQSGILFRDTSSDSIARLQSSIPLGKSQSTLNYETHFCLEAGQKASFTWVWGRSAPDPLFPEMRHTVDVWRRWGHHCAEGPCAFAGPWHDLVSRSALLLKMMSSPMSGAIAEAATTSIPVIAGGSRTWDYRFAWMRDTALFIQSLANLGFTEESKNLFQGLSDILMRDDSDSLQAVYTLDGGKTLPEAELDHLSGYHDSKPVRIGNSSAELFQLDLYGHLFMAAAEYYKHFGSLPEGLWAKLSDLANVVCQVWRRPDHGPWEVRSAAEHFTTSKIMCWVALDRACWLARVTGEKGTQRWVDEAKVLHRTICQQGYDEQKRSFVRSFGSRDLDASTLLIPLVRFLPIDDPRVQSTLEAVQKELATGALVRRYTTHDGIDDGEGANLVASFTLVSCLALAGRVDEASERLSELCSLATPLGILAEQVDLEREEISGNIPYAPAHVALINAALYIGMARGRQTPLKHLIGMPDQLGQRFSARKRTSRS